MQDFRALSSSQGTKVADMMEEQCKEDIPVTQQIQEGQILPLQIILFGSPSGHYVGAPLVGTLKCEPATALARLPCGSAGSLGSTPTTEQLAPISDASSTTPTTSSLVAALQSAMSPEATNRTVVIPGSRKRKQSIKERTEQSELSLYRRWVTPRIRHGIVISAILFVAITTLLTLTPLGKGQYPFSLVGAISNWFHVDQVNWQIQAHDDALSSWQYYAPQPPMILPKSQYVAIAEQDAVDAGISPEYFVRQINLESGFNPYAVSPAGAVGIAQFLPGTAAGLGVDPWNPVSALRGAARLMASYANAYGGDYAKALAAYNGGTGTVQYAVRACGANWLNCIPWQTRNYIYVVMGI